jgi:hypothetical protein
MRIPFICAVACVLLLVVAATGRPGTAQTPAPPADLIALDRHVSLRIAHVRIKGPSNAADFKQMLEAERIEAEGRKAMQAGDYRKAEDDFLRANVIIGRIAE